MVMPLTAYYTAEMVLALPDDGNRYETVHGELLVTPSPAKPHQVILARLDLILANYLAANGMEGVLWSPADITFGPDTLVQPDLFVVDQESYLHAKTWADIREIYLVAEVLSPSSIRADRFTKRRLYQERRIPDYWVVDIDRQQFEVWTPEAIAPTIARDQVTWRHPAIAEPCVIEVSALFR
ncbi:MAG: Uma2 family endonuclease [Gemmatimonadales bacterium]